MRLHLAWDQHLSTHRICGADDQRGFRECVSFVLTAPVAAVLDLSPVLGPLLAPLKGQVAAHTDLGLKAVLYLCGAGHGSMVGES